MFNPGFPPRNLTAEEWDRQTWDVISIFELKLSCMVLFYAFTTPYPTLAITHIWGVDAPHLTAFLDLRYSLFLR